MRGVWLLVSLALLVGITPVTQAQFDPPCGVVDAIDFPIDISDTLRDGYDDFALYRARFGGNHVGLDIGFNRWGDPVLAVARGRVTYSDIEAWDTEKGVVIVEHTFPDGSIVYSLYGHMEQGDTTFFPAVGECVERGDIVGLIGWPSRGLPHLHYELRGFLPNDGGPGYVTDNPLLTGWYHPLDYTLQWRVRLQPGFIDAASYLDVPSLPPALVDSGLTVVSSGMTVGAFNPAGDALWRVSATSAIVGLSALPGDRVSAYTREGQAFTMSASSGRYLAIWDVDGLDIAFVTSGETLVFALPDGGLQAYTPLGDPLWTLPGDANGETRIVHFETGTQGEIALGVRVSDDTRAANAVRWRLIDPSGAVLHETTFAAARAFTALPGGGWLVLDGAQLYRVASGTETAIAQVTPPAGRTARLASDIVGNVYVYLGDADSTLLSLDPYGGVRWRTTYPAGLTSLAPLLDVGGGCTLYTLDPDGMLNAFDTISGDLVAQRQLYAGGVQSGSPRARILQVDTAERIRVNAGFLSTFTLDGTALGRSCLLG